MRGGAPYAVDPADHDLEVRRKADAADGLGLTLLSLSSPLGIELLPAAESTRCSTPGTRAWTTSTGLPDLGGAPARRARPGRAGRVLARSGVRGLQVPATVLTTPAALEQAAPLLRVAEAADLPVLVHPGPVVSPSTTSPAGGRRRRLPRPAGRLVVRLARGGPVAAARLRIGFVALAGLAPLHHERLAQRGGRLGPLDAGVCYETPPTVGRPSTP